MLCVYVSRDSKNLSVLFYLHFFYFISSTSTSQHLKIQRDWLLQENFDETQAMFSCPVLHYHQVSLVIVCLLSLQSWLIAYFSCLHIGSRYISPLSPSRWLNNENQSFECYNNLHSSLRDCNVCQIRFTDVLWSYSEDKMTVLKIVIFQASVHVLPMGWNRAMMAAFGCVFFLLFPIAWVTSFWSCIFVNLSPFPSCINFPVALDCEIVVPHCDAFT